MDKTNSVHPGICMYMDNICTSPIFRRYPGLHWMVAKWWWLYTHSWVIGEDLCNSRFLPVEGLQELAISNAVVSHSNGVFLRQVEMCWPGSWEYTMDVAVVGSCWALMLVVFGLGMSSPLWMALVTLIIMIEKAMPDSHHFRQILGGVLLLLALFWCLFSVGLFAGNGIL